jgi:hypothetical protein
MEEEEYGGVIQDSKRPVCRVSCILPVGLDAGWAMVAVWFHTKSRSQSYYGQPGVRPVNPEARATN